MTYRDELTAATARIETLERELAATRRERDVLRAECERLRKSALRPPSTPLMADATARRSPHRRGGSLRSAATGPRGPSDRCPACGQGELEGAELGELNALSCCRRCGGIWLGAQALTELIEAAGRRILGFEPREADLLWEGESTPKRPSYIRCPECAEMMLRRAHTGAKVVLDVCTAHGLWLDRGELPRLLEAAAAGSTANPLQSTAFGGEPAQRSAEGLLGSSRSEGVLDWIGSLLTTKVRLRTRRPW